MSCKPTYKGKRYNSIEELKTANNNLNSDQAISDMDKFVGESLSDIQLSKTKNNNLSEIIKDKVTDSKEVLKTLAKNGKLGPLVKQLLKTDLSIPIVVVDAKYLDSTTLADVTFKEGQRSAALYNHANRTIYIAKNTNFKYSAENTLLHEILHGYSHFYLRNTDNNLTRNFNRLFQHVKTNEKLFSDTYPLTNVDEFLVGIYTNPVFALELKNLPATNKNFKSMWEELMNFFKVLLGISDRTLFDEVFSSGAEILQDVQEQGEEQALYEDSLEVLMDEPSKEANIISARLDRLQSIVSKVNEEYIVKGFENVWKRASSIAKKKIQGRAFDAPTPEQEEINNLRMEAGTIIHAIQANIIKEAFPEYNTHIELTEIPAELSGMELALKEQLQPYINNAKAKGGILKSEVFVGNSDTSIAGTIDILEITKDGNYIIYDLKNRFTEDKSAFRRFERIGEWSDQTIEYKKILEKGDSELGIVKGKVEGVFILELDLQSVNKGVKFNSKGSFKGKNNAVKYLMGRNFTRIVSVAPTFLRTGNDKLDKTIENVLRQIETSKTTTPRTEIEKEAKEQLFKNKIDLLQSLQLKRDMNILIDSGYSDLFEIERILDSGDIKNEQQFIEEHLPIYIDILKYVDEKELDAKQLAKLKEVSFKAKSLQSRFEEFGKQLVIENANNTGVTKKLKEFGKDLFSAVQDAGWFRKMTMGVSTLDNPIVASAFSLLTTTLGQARNKTQILAEKIAHARNEFVAIMGNDYTSLIDYNSKGEPMLVQEFSPEFYSERYKAKKVNDADWFNENVTYDKQAYLNKRDKQLEWLETYKKSVRNKIKVNNPELTDLEVDKELIEYEKFVMAEWDSKNKGNVVKYFIPKSKWKNSKWLDIKQGKYKGTAVEKFYDLYLVTLDTARELRPDLHNNFIANFQASFLERTGNVGLLGAIQGNWSGMLDSVEADYDREKYSTRNATTGEIINQLFIPGTSEKNAKDKSTDLALSLFKFMEGVYRFQELTQIEQTIQATKHYVRNETLFVQKDSLGRVIDPLKSPAIINKSSNTADMFDNWVDSAFYGIKNKDESAFELKGNGLFQVLGILNKGETKKISYAKIIDKIQGYTMLRNLGFNLYAPIVNLLSGSANMYMTGAGGLYYDKENITKAFGLVLGGKTNFPNEDVQKARLILNWLQIDTGEFKKDLEKEISSSKIERVMNDYNAMSVMQMSESVLKDSGAMAMVLSGKNGLNWDSFKVVNGKLETSLSLFQKEAFRQKAIKVNSKNIGGFNQDDMMLAKSYIAGRLLMQHRSWLPAMGFERFGGKQFDYVLGHDIEGRYITAFRCFKALFNKSKTNSKLTDWEKANLRSSATELGLLISVGVLLALSKAALDDDDKKEAWYKITNKINSRVFNELLFFADPTFQSQWQVLLSPAASVSTIEDFGKFMGSLYTEATESDKTKLKRNHPMKKGLKLIPVVSKGYTFFEDLGLMQK